MNSSESERSFRYQCACGQWRDDLALAAEHAADCEDSSALDRAQGFRQAQPITAEEVSGEAELTEVRS